MQYIHCLLYTSDAADDLLCVDLGGRRIIKKKKRIGRISRRQEHKRTNVKPTNKEKKQNQRADKIQTP